MEKIEKKEEQRDTTGDTKVFQIVRKEDIEREKKKQAIQDENKVNKSKVNKGNIPTKLKEQTSEKPVTMKSATVKPAKARSSTEKPVTVKPVTVKSATEQPAEVKQPTGKQATKKQLTEKQLSEEQIPKYNNYQQEENQKQLNNYQEPAKKSHKKGVLITLLIIILLALVLVVFSTVFALKNMNCIEIVKGVNINNVDVSNLTKEQAIDKISQQLDDEENNKATVKYGSYSKEVSINDINGKFDIETAVNNAYNIGRDNDIVANNYTTLLTMIKGKNVDVGLNYDDEALTKLINDISIDLPDVAMESTYVIDNDKLIIKNSKAGIQISRKEFVDSLTKAMLSDDKAFEIPVEKVEKKKIDIEKIYKEVYKQPVDAYYTTEPRQVYKEVEGIDFAITVEEAKKIIEEDKAEYEIPLKKIEPQVKLANLDSGAYPDLLSTFTTKYGTADVNRNTNIALAAKSINSVVVMPGEVFSYNDLIGECSTRTGYKTSTIYLNGELSTGVGGGICQVSTTLYNTVLRANLEIVQRRNHSLGVTYVPAGQDAMVSIGSSDFKFKNNRDYPVKVVAYTGTGSITCEIYGLKQETEYEVKLQSRTIEKTDEKYKVQTYKVLYLNGKEVSRTWLSTDTYKYH